MPGVRKFTAAGKTVAVYPAVAPGAPLVVLNTFGGEGGQAAAALRQAGSPPCTLVAVSGLDWSRDMPPWDAPPLAPGEAPFAGGAGEYLDRLLGTILPKAESGLALPPAWRGIAGYSLAGLFAVYALYRTDVFCRAASVSGSLWYPGLLEFVQGHAPKRLPERLYFSVGDRECRARSPSLQRVQANAEWLARFYRAQGVETCFVLNPGGHSSHAARRTAAGIAWLLDGADG